jgi:hypothetical protein
MEEICSSSRINSEGRGMSASTQEYDMNSKQILAGAAIAAVLAMASPAYAGHLSGAGGLGGNLGGSLGGFGGASHPVGAGGLDSQGGLNSSFSSTNTKPVNTKPVSKTADKADGTAAATATNAPAKSASAAPAAKGPAPAPAATPEKPSASTNLAGGADQTATAGSRAVSGGAGGSLDAQHSKGSTSAAAAGTASESIN